MVGLRAMSSLIARPGLMTHVRTALGRSRAVALIGPRQVGKTTLARGFLPPGSPNYFDLEDPRDLERIAQPMTAIEPLRGLVVIDEVQRRPDLFPVPPLLGQEGKYYFSPPFQGALLLRLWLKDTDEVQSCR